MCASCCDARLHRSPKGSNAAPVSNRFGAAYSNPDFYSHGITDSYIYRYADCDVGADFDLHGYVDTDCLPYFDVDPNLDRYGNVDTDRYADSDVGADFDIYSHGVTDCYADMDVDAVSNRDLHGNSDGNAYLYADFYSHRVTDCHDAADTDTDRDCPRHRQLLQCHLRRLLPPQLTPTCYCNSDAD